MAVEGMNTEYWLSEARLLEPYDLMVFCLISPADSFLYTEGGKLGVYSSILFCPRL